MITIHVGVDVDRPASEVFAWVADLRNDPAWWKGVRSCVRLAGDGGVGTLYRQESSLLGVSDLADLEVTAYEPPHRQVFVVRQGRLGYTATYECTDTAPGSSRFAMTAEIVNIGPWSRLGPLFRPVVQLIARRYFGSLPRLMPAAPIAGER